MAKFYVKSGKLKVIITNVEQARVAAIEGIKHASGIALDSVISVDERGFRDAPHPQEIHQVYNPKTHKLEDKLPAMAAENWYDTEQILSEAGFTFED